MYKSVNMISKNAHESKIELRENAVGNYLYIYIIQFKSNVQYYIMSCIYKYYSYLVDLDNALCMILYNLYYYKQH